MLVYSLEEKSKLQNSFTILAETPENASSLGALIDACSAP